MKLKTVLARGQILGEDHIVAVDTVLSVWNVRDENTVDTRQEPTKL